MLEVEKGHYRLQPENSSMEPIIVDEVTILGKVIGLIRMMRPVNLRA